MRKLRFWMSASLAWFFVLFNIERFHEPINISSFVYVLAFVLALLIVGVPPMRNRATWALVAVSLVVFVVLKQLLQYQLLGASTPLTVTEAVIITVSVLLANKVAWSIQQFEKSVLEITALNIAKNALDFGEVQVDIYREVRRARNFQRPLSVVAIETPQLDNQIAIDGLLEEVQRQTKQRYLHSQVAQLISSEISDSDILSLRDDHFVLVLTESNVKRAEQIAQRISERLRNSLTCHIRTGIASFPDEEMTLAALLTRAEENLAMNITSDANGHTQPSNGPLTEPSTRNGSPVDNSVGLIHSPK